MNACICVVVRKRILSSAATAKRQRQKNAKRFIELARRPSHLKSHPDVDRGR